jgi:hypothetical protein
VIANLLLMLRLLAKLKILLSVIANVLFRLTLLMKLNILPNVTANWLLVLRLLAKLKITLMKMYGNPLLLNHQLMIKSVAWSWTLTCAI